MLKQLKDKRERLWKKSAFLEQFAGISGIFTLLTIGSTIGTIPNSKYNAEYFKISSIASVWSVASLVAFSRAHKATEDEIELNMKLIEQTANSNPACWGCIYSSSDKRLPCAIHPGLKPDGCSDKVLRYFE